jgi:hypothetical protein
MDTSYMRRRAGAGEIFEPMIQVLEMIREKTFNAPGEWLESSLSNAGKGPSYAVQLFPTGCLRTLQHRMLTAPAYDCLPVRCGAILDVIHQGLICHP